MKIKNNLVKGAVYLILSTVLFLALVLLDNQKIEQIDLNPTSTRIRDNQSIEPVSLVLFDDQKESIVIDTQYSKTLETLEIPENQKEEEDYYEYMLNEAVRLGLPNYKRFKLGFGLSFKDVTSLEVKPKTRDQVTSLLPPVDLRLGYLFSDRSEIGIKTDSHLKPHIYYSYSYPVFLKVRAFGGLSLGLNQSDYRRVSFRILENNQTQKYQSKQGFNVGNKGILLPELGLSVDFELIDDLRGNLQYDIPTNSVRFGVSFNF